MLPRLLIKSFRWLEAASGAFAEVGPVNSQYKKKSGRGRFLPRPLFVPLLSFRRGKGTLEAGLNRLPVMFREPAYQPEAGWQFHVEIGPEGSRLT